MLAATPHWCSCQPWCCADLAGRGHSQTSKCRSHLLRPQWHQYARLESHIVHVHRSGILTEPHMSMVCIKSPAWGLSCSLALALSWHAPGSWGGPLHRPSTGQYCLGGRLCRCCLGPCWASWPPGLCGRQPLCSSRRDLCCLKCLPYLRESQGPIAFLQWVPKVRSPQHQCFLA